MLRRRFVDFITQYRCEWVYVSVYNTIVSVSNFDGQVVNQVSFVWRCIFLLISHIVFDFSVFFFSSSLDAFDLLVYYYFEYH